MGIDGLYRFPPWFALLVLSRDLLILFGALLIKWRKGSLEAVPNALGKTTAVLQMALVIWVLLGLPRPAPALAATAAFTIASGIGYLIYGVRRLQSDPSDGFDPSDRSDGSDLSGPISVLMPAFNEGRHIYQNLRETAKVIGKIHPDYEIVAIDDGSSDDTRSEIERAARENGRILPVILPENRGKGWALRKGFARSRGRWVFFLDSDLDIHPRQFLSLLRVQKETAADVVIGSKRHPDSTLSYPLSRRIISAGYFFLVKALFGLPLRDTQTGIKLFRREVLEATFPRILVKQYAFDLEILVNAHSLGFAIAEAPVVVEYRGKFGRIGLGSIWTILNDTLAVFYRRRVLRYYDRPVMPWARSPRVSIVIACAADGPYLREALDHIARLDYPDFETIVLPDRPFEIGLPRVKVIPTGEVGPPRKRDRGVELSAGEIVAFLDDDAYPEPDWLLTAVRHFADPSVAGVGGPAVTPEKDPPLQQAGGRVLSCLMVGGRETYRFIPKTFKEVDDYPTANLLVRRSDFLAAGGFQTPYWPGEDTFLCLKLTKRLGKRIVYDPDAVVRHHRRPLFAAHLRQIGNYGLHRGYFAKRFPETSLRAIYFAPTLLAAFLLLGWLPLSLIPGGLVFYAVPVVLYLLLALLTSLRGFSPKTAPAVFGGIIATHFVYGVQFVRGLLAKRLPEEKPASA